MNPPPTRQALVALLEQCHVSLPSFDALRCDSYEKHLAEHSLAELETFYERLLKPGAGYEAIQSQCPRWHAGHKFSGRLPSLVTLRTIRRRLLADQALDDLTRQAEFLKSLKKRLTGVSAADQNDIFDAILALMNEELLGARLDGQPLLKNLPALDRLLKAAAVRARIRQGDTRNRLREKIQGGRLKLDREKFEHQVKQAKAEAMPHGGPDNEPEVEHDEDNSGMTDREKTQAWIESIYGPKPK